MTRNGTRRSRLNLAGFAVLAVMEAFFFAFDLAAGHVAVGLLTVAIYLAGAGLFFGVSARKQVKATPAAGPPEPLKTHAEEMAEAVEALRQRQWDVIADRAYLAAGGQKPRVALKVDPVRWLASAADEFMRTGQRPRGLVLPEGVIGAQADVLAGKRKRQREVKLTMWLQDGRVYSVTRHGNGAANALSLGTVFVLPEGKPRPREAVPMRDAETGEVVGGARPGATTGPCAHPDAEPVDLITGERVAWCCPDCPADLPAGWTPAGP